MTISFIKSKINDKKCKKQWKNKKKSKGKYKNFNNTIQDLHDKIDNGFRNIKLTD